VNPSTARALDRLLRQMDRPPRRPRFSTAPLVMGLGLVLGYQLLVRLVPRVWSTTLPGGLAQARFLRGWPGLVWRLAWFCYYDFRTVLVIGGLLVAGAIVVSGWLRPLRFLVWLAAVGVILADAGIVYVTLRTALEATAAASGIGQGPAPVLISPAIEDDGP
jgi:hypothetical protein